MKYINPPFKFPRHGPVIGPASKGATANTQFHVSLGAESMKQEVGTSIISFFDGWLVVRTQNCCCVNCSSSFLSKFENFTKPCVYDPHLFYWLLNLSKLVVISHYSNFIWISFVNTENFESCYST